MQATPFSTKGITKAALIDFGKISVGDKMVNTITRTNKTLSKTVFCEIAYQSATPKVAIINVGDSAL